MKKLFLMLLAAATLEARPIAVTNVNVIPMTSTAVLTKQVVLVDEGKIVAIGKEGDVTIPVNAQHVDGQGGYLLPGLIDLHVHVTQPDDLSLYVANGVTTVFNLSGDSVMLTWRKGNRLMPRLLTTGPPLVGVPSAQRAKAIVEEEAAAGYDGIKIYDDIALEALPALVDAARAKGLFSIGHIPRNLRWQDMLAAKPDAIAHAEEFLYSPVEEGDDARIVAGMKSGGISLITTLITYDLIGRQVADLESLLVRGENVYANPVMRRAWQRPYNGYTKRFNVTRVPNLRRLLTFQKRLIKELADGGVPILLGTDAGGPAFVMAGFSAIDELRELVSCGLTPYAALRAATIDPARFLRREQELGTIEPGKAADFVIVRGNPLDDIENIALRAGVMLRGRWLDEKELRAELDAVAARNRADEALVSALATGGADRLIAVAKRDHARDTSLNELAYQLLKIEDNTPAALKVFRANAALHPESMVARDSLKEVTSGQ
jgi:imidazolonepropionase-like amidohydrolase